jgi:uncharacterized protein DUF4340
MNRKQFLILVIALVVLGGAGLALFWQNIAAYRSSGAKIGARLLPGLKVGDVAEMDLQDVAAHVTLERKDKNWGVRERGGYPVNLQELSDLLNKLAELKVVQSEAVSANLLPRLGLGAPVQAPKPAPAATGSAAPAAQASGMGTRVDLKDAAGKSLGSLMIGKVVLKKDPGNPLPSAQNGVPAGRYVMVSGATSVAVVSDPLNSAEANPAKWLDRSFFKAERIKTLTAAGDSGVRWKITRDEEYGQWKFAGGGGELDASAAVGAVNALANLGFKDVALEPHPAAGQKPVTVTADTFDNLTYTVKLVRGGGDDYLLNFTVAGQPPKQRTPEKDEKPQDKERRDKEYAETLKKLEERVAREQARSKWTYVMESKAVAPLLRERAELVAQKRPPIERKAR